MEEEQPAIPSNSQTIEHNGNTYIVTIENGNGIIKNVKGNVISGQSPIGTAVLNKVNWDLLEEQPAPTTTVSDKKAVVEVISENYTPELLKANPDKLFLFGDNNTRTGKGGQAIIRDEPNAIGISTKLLPKNTPEAFMSDVDFASNKAIINDDIYKAKQRAVKEGKTIVLPKGGFGTGLAALVTKAPQTFVYLNQRLQEEFGFNNTTGELAALEGTQTQPKAKPSFEQSVLSGARQSSISPEEQRKLEAEMAGEMAAKMGNNTNLADLMKELDNRGEDVNNKCKQ